MAILKVNKDLRVIFMGSPEYVVPLAETINQSRHKLVAVYTQPPRPKNRGKIIRKSPLHEWAERTNVPVYTPPNFKDENEVQTYTALKADIAIVAAYGLILPEAILNAPRLGCINVHPSRLPAYRGASPLQYALLNGDRETAVSFMQLEKTMDAGPIIEQYPLSIHAEDTYGSLNAKAWEIAESQIIRILDNIADADMVSAIPQDHEAATYCEKIDKSGARIDWNEKVENIQNRIRAFHPVPVAWTMLSNDKRLKIFKADVASTVKLKPGQITDDGMIGCGQGALRIIEAQPENKKRMDRQALINGHYLNAGLTAVNADKNAN